jgi:hypothetical protein
MNELITVRSFSNSMDFEMVKSYLESCLKKKDFEPTPEMKWMEKVLDFFHKK